MTLSLVYRLNGLIGLIWAASMWLTPEMMAAHYFSLKVHPIWLRWVNI